MKKKKPTKKNQKQKCGGGLWCRLHKNGKGPILCRLNCSSAGGRRGPVLVATRIRDGGVFFGLRLTFENLWLVADEVTYPLHVIVRFELERGLFDGSISLQDLPEAWDQKMETYLGVRPPSNKEGVLQVKCIKSCIHKSGISTHSHIYNIIYTIMFTK